ncbi:heavy-metal-associated domain-containing protein [Microbacterium sp.]|uniref:heavy-metal-associated domain-containing protein n=1 Tax=Microbacterium sp. TaxID=51671 RepID=UPI0025E73C9B|nr:heavy-metal-associated domain-containing protein [Microbacterium sp.]
MNIQSYAVDGMTCDHCSAAVTREVRGVAGVDDVIVDVSSGTLTVTTDGTADAQIAAAVSEAGYTLVGRK